MASGRVPIVVGISISEEGEVTTDAGGLAAISFVKAYPTKPRFHVVPPEYDPAVEGVFLQVGSWVFDPDGNYIGANVYCVNDAGKTVAGVPVKWLILE